MSAGKPKTDAAGPPAAGLEPAEDLERPGAAEEAAARRERDGGPDVRTSREGRVNVGFGHGLDMGRVDRRV